MVVVDRFEHRDRPRERRPSRRRAASWASSIAPTASRSPAFRRSTGHLHRRSRARADAAPGDRRDRGRRHRASTTRDRRCDGVRAQEHAAMEVSLRPRMRQLTAVGRGRGGGGQGEVLHLSERRSAREANVVRRRARARAHLDTGVPGAHRQPAAQPHAEDARPISEGLVVDRELSQLSWLEAKAAAAHVTIHSL